MTALWPALVLILAAPAAGWVLGLTVHWFLELRALTRQQRALNSTRIPR